VTTRLRFSMAQEDERWLGAVENGGAARSDDGGAGRWEEGDDG
jgi:hypothetical protein